MLRNPLMSLFLFNGHPIYWTSDPLNMPDCIDFFLIKGPSFKLTFTSDHSTIILILSNSIRAGTCKQRNTQTGIASSCLKSSADIDVAIVPFLVILL